MAQGANAGALELYMEEDKSHKSLVPDEVVIRDYLSCIYDDTWVRHAELVKLEELKESLPEEEAKQEVLRSLVDQWRTTHGEPPRDLILEGILWQERFMEEYKRDRSSQDKAEAVDYKKRLLSTFRTKRSNVDIPSAAQKAMQIVTKAHENEKKAPVENPDYAVESPAIDANNLTKDEDVKDQNTVPNDIPPSQPDEPDHRELGDPAPEAEPHSAPGDFPVENQAEPDDQPIAQPDEVDHRDNGEPSLVSQPHSAAADVPDEAQGEPDDQPIAHPDEVDHRDNGEPSLVSQPHSAAADVPDEAQGEPDDQPIAQPDEVDHRELGEDGAELYPVEQKGEEVHGDEAEKQEMDEPIKTIPQPMGGEEAFEHELDDPASKPENIASDEAHMDEM